MENVNENINKNHSRVSLSGIFNACRGCVVQKQQSVEDPRLQISGMAPLFDDSKNAFTLIELLIVVLIIGILTAIALPQYQKAVTRARLTQAIVLTRSVAEAEVRYCLANGSLATKLTDLDIELPAAFSMSADGTSASGNEYRFGIWVNDAGTGGAVIGKYQGISYLQNFYPCRLGGQSCRANENDTLSQSVCLGMGGEYTATYEGLKDYRLNL